MSNFSKAGLDWITGTVKMVQTEKGFGFIRGVDDGIEYFFHRSAADDFEALTVGMAVRFVPKEGSKGPRADRVEAL